MGWGGDGMCLCPRTFDSIHSYHRSIEHDSNPGREVIGSDDIHRDV